MNFNLDSVSDIMTAIAAIVPLLGMMLVVGIKLAKFTSWGRNNEKNLQDLETAVLTLCGYIEKNKAQAVKDDVKAASELSPTVKEVIKHYADTVDDGKETPVEKLVDKLRKIRRGKGNAS